jgi:hypothetical protein
MTFHFDFYIRPVRLSSANITVASLDLESIQHKILSLTLGALPVFRTSGEVHGVPKQGGWLERPLFHGLARPAPSRAPLGRHETFDFHADTNPGYRKAIDLSPRLEGRPSLTARHLPLAPRTCCGAAGGTATRVEGMNERI